MTWRAMTWHRPDAHRTTRTIDENHGQSPPRTTRPAAEGILLHGREQGLGRQGDRALSGGPPAIGGDPAAVARAGTGRRLAAAGGDRACRRDARHGEDPRARGRDL